MNCGHCKYWSRFDRKDNEGECRLNPPSPDLQAIAMIVLDLSQGREYDDDEYMFMRSTMWWSFPVTDVMSWCGQGE